MSSNHSDHNWTQDRDDDSTKVPLLGSCRLVFTICCFFTMFNMVMMRFNLSFAMVCMVREPNITMEGNSSITALGYDCPAHQENPGSPAILKGELDWSKPLQGRILSAFFYGYFGSQALGGWASDRWGGKLLFVLGNLLQSAVTLIIPEAARWHPELLFVLRILQGLFCGLTFPSIFQLYSRWAAPSERTALMGIAYTGFPLANVAIFPLAGVLCQFEKLGGWPSIFYVTGTLGAISSIASYFLVFDNPNSHPRISVEEKRYLNSTSVPDTSKPPKLVWKSVCTSGPVIAYFICHFCYAWGFITLAVGLPLYMREVLFFDLNQNGLLSAMPYLGVLSVRILVSSSFNWCQKRTGFNTTQMRKFNHTIGTLGAGASMLCVAALSCQHQFVAVLLLTLGQAVSDLAFTGGYVLSFLDMAPRLAGTLTGAANAFASLPGIVSPTLVGYLTPHGAREEWAVVLHITGGFYLLGAVTYLLMGSSELQPWAREEPDIELTDKKRLTSDTDTK